MPQTVDGVQKMFNYWVYGVLRTARSLGNWRVFLRSTLEEGVRSLVERQGFRTRAFRDAEDACRAYVSFMDGLGAHDATDTTIRAEGPRIRAEIGAGCPYRMTCTTVHDEGDAVLCFRAIALAAMLRLTLDQEVRWSLDSFGLPCRVTLVPPASEVTSRGD